MKYTKYTIAALCALLLSSAGLVVTSDAQPAIQLDAGWKPASGLMMTRWAKDVSPKSALPEYPRPQMVRSDWLNLNGLWDIKLGDGTSARILVPYPIESALSGVMKHSDRMTYHRRFEIPKEWSGRHKLLHFGAVDWETNVSVNGKELGVHRGGYDPFSFDITDALKSEGPQEITVEVFDPTNDGGQPRGKQTLHPGGIMYTPTSGIWQTVWLEPVEEAHIASLKLVPDLDAGCLRLTADAAGTVEAVASDGGKQVAQVSGDAGKELKLVIPNPKLWSPDTPHLYDLEVTLKSGDKVVDKVTSYFGMRKIALGKDEKGITRPQLNGKFVFQVGPLDQGFWPDGLYTAPTDEALRGDIEAMKKFGFNCVRKHIKVEPDRWYYWCDKLGLMVWQDMPSANSYLSRKEKEQNIAVDKPQYKTELMNMVRNHWNHPSIIMWVIFNEGQGQHDTEVLTDAVKALDPSRMLSSGSGCSRKSGDVIDIHKYPGPGSPKPEEKRAAVLGEFGGLGLAVEGHTWNNRKVWGYRGAADSPGLTKGYEKLLAKAWGLKDDSGLSAVIYTQLTDVEIEGNGLLTYDREITKVNSERAAAANTGKLPSIVDKDLVPTSQLNGVNWRFTFDQPAPDWFKPEFSDSPWKEGPGGFGTKAAHTEWKTDDIWLRRSFEWPNKNAGTPMFLVNRSGDVEIYINGVLAAKASGFADHYEEMDITPEGVTALKPGKNWLAVHCHQNAGGKYLYVDAGIFARTLSGK